MGSRQEQQQQQDLLQQHPQDSFQARPSSKIGKDIQADGDTWQETLAVCETQNSKLVIRSFYENKRNGKRVWDEPPSGATHIKLASDEMKKMAHLQLQEMQVVTGAVEGGDQQQQQQQQKPGRMGFFFRRQKAKKPSPKEKRKIQYMPGSKLVGQTGVGGGDDINDPRLQEAIERSIAESQGIEYKPTNGEPVILSQFSSQEEDEQLALAKALSMSEADDSTMKKKHTSAAKIPEETEEEQLRRVLEESKIDAARKIPPSSSADEADLLGLAAAPHPSSSSTKPSAVSVWSDDMEKKPAATPTKKPPPLVLETQQQKKAPPPYASSPVNGVAAARSFASVTPTAAASPAAKTSSVVLSSPVAKASPSARLSPPQTKTTTNNYDSTNSNLKPPPPGFLNIPSSNMSDPVATSSNAVPTKTTTTSDVSMFDPYAKDSPYPATSNIQAKLLAAQATPQANASTNSKDEAEIKLHKMSTDESQQRKSRLSFGRRQSSKKIQDKAGLV